MIPVVDMESFTQRLESQSAQAREAGRESFYADVVFAPPETNIGQDLRESLDYLDELSGEVRHFYFPGYGRGPLPPDGQELDGTDWWFSLAGYLKFGDELEKHWEGLEISRRAASFAVMEVNASDDFSLFGRNRRHEFIGESTDLRKLVKRVDHSKRNHGVMESSLVRWGIVPDKTGPVLMGAALATFLRGVVMGSL